MPLLAGSWSVPSSSYCRRLKAAWEGRAGFRDPGVGERKGGRQGGRQPRAVWGAAAQSGLVSKACMATLSLLPLDHSSGSRGPTQKPCSLGTASEEAQRRHSLVVHPPPRNLSQHIKTSLGQQETWMGSLHPWEARRPGPAPLSKCLHLSEPQCSSSGEWVSKYPSV